METATLPARAAIGGPVPGYDYFTVRPIVRIESHGAAGLWMEATPYPGDVAAGNYLAAVDDSGDVGPPLAFPAWSAAPEYLLPHNRHGYRPAVRIVATGRKPARWGGEYWLRARVEFCHDGGESTFAPAWLLLD